MAADIGTGFVANVAAKVLEYMGKLAFEKIAPYFGGEMKLKDLKKTMEMIQARLADAERRGEAENGEAVKVWLRRLKRALYRFEDLLEEVEMAEADNDNEEEIEHMSPSSSSSSRGKQLLLNCTSCVPFSKWSKPLMISKLVADEAKAIMEELASIQSDMGDLNLVSVRPSERSLIADDHNETNNSRETHSFVVEGDVTGRDDDKKRILVMLLNSEDNDHVDGENVSVILIGGIGGLGKTTLAQFVYNDATVQNHFELKIWACISKVSSLKEIVQKILHSIPGENCHQDNLDLLQTRLRKIVKDKKYLLVLDDVWNEDPGTWLQLKGFLCGGKQGSKIIVTSRSMIVAQNMAGTVDVYELGVLSPDQSWALFRRLAFKEGQEERNPSLTSIGKQIVNKCGNLPLAIRTIAGLLRSKDTQQEWEYFRDNELRRIEPDIIMSTLKLSYDHLSSSHVKQCFAYCSLFPKDHRFDMQHLIELWMAQGFLGLSKYGHQALENVGHGYFMELQRRSFFQEVTTSDYGITCKMHDLVHDLAVNVARGENLLIDGPGPTEDINDDTVHLSFLYDDDLSWKVPSSLALLTGKKLLRSYIVGRAYSSGSCKLKMDVHHEALSKLRHVRALDLRGVDCESLPNSIEKLKHLRLLRLCSSYLESLPEGITKLRYLQTLDLRKCDKLRQLPNSLSNLNSLRHLYIPEHLLMDLPPRFERLTCLRKLGEFIVGEKNGLDALASLKHLAGRLRIRFVVKWRGNLGSEKSETGILKETNITWLQIISEESGTASDQGDQEEKEGAYSILECLQPPPSLKKLKVEYWKGTRFPSWGMDHDGLRCQLPNLVTIDLYGCSRCKHLPPFSRLPRLRSLRLLSLRALEHVESGNDDREAATSSSPYFPSLETLVLKYLPKLKGWSRVEGQDDNDQTTTTRQRLLPISSFPRLLELRIRRCPELMSIPLVPQLVKLEAREVHGKVVKHLLCGDDGDDDDDDDQEHSHSPSDTTLTYMRMEEVHELDSLSLVHLSSLQSLAIWKCKDLIDLRLKSPSLQSLNIKFCRDLINLRLESPISLRVLNIDGCGLLKGDLTADVLQRCSALEVLRIGYCDELDWGDNNNWIWQGLTSLRKLSLSNIPRLPRGLVCLPALQELNIAYMPNLRALPEGIGQLSHLRYLIIHDCHELTALPRSIRNLTQLQELRMWNCPDIKRRCREPDGEDWPLIRHIPSCVIMDPLQQENQT